MNIRKVKYSGHWQCGSVINLNITSIDINKLRKFLKSAARNQRVYKEQELKYVIDWTENGQKMQESGEFVNNRKWKVEAYEI